MTRAAKENLESRVDALKTASSDPRDLPYKSLYTLQDMPKETRILYSRHTLGDMIAIETFAAGLYGMIYGELGREIIANPDGWILVNGPHLAVRNNSSYLADYIEDKLRIQRVHIKRSLYSGSKLYTRAPPNIKRRIAQQSLYYEGKVSFSGKKAIFIDNSIVTGIVYDTVRAILLENGAACVMAYAVVKIENPAVSDEINLDRTAITEKGVDEILDILKTPRHVVTSRLITFLSELKAEEIKYLIDNLDSKKLHELKDAVIVYHSYGKSPASLLRLLQMDNRQRQ